MPYKKQKNKNGLGKAMLALVLVLVFLLGAGGSFVAFGGLSALLAPVPKAPPGYATTAPVRAMRLAPPEDGAQTEEALRAYFEDAAAYALQNGLNTLVFTAKTGLLAWWQDEVFAPAVTAVDAAGAAIDPLAILCEVLEGQPLQLWLEVDPYSTDGAEATLPGSAAALWQKQGGPGAFDAADRDYRRLLVKSLGGLPLRYSLSGLVLSGFAGTAAADADVAAFEDGLAQVIEELHTALANEGRLMPIALGFSQDSGLLGTAKARSLAQDGLVSHLLPNIAPGRGVAQRVGQFSGSPFIAVHPWQDAGMFLFTAGQIPSCGGALFGSYSQLTAEPGRLGFLQSVLVPVDAPMPTAFSISSALSVTYPAAGAKISTEGLFIMGTSDPTRALTVNGNEVADRPANGVFGVYVTLEMGDNQFTLAQGEQSLTLPVTRVAPTGGTGGGTPKTPPGKAGSVVQITSLIANANTDGGNINETLHQGAVFVVAEAVANTSGGSYRMPSGNWVAASNCTVIGGNGKSSFTGLAAAEDAYGERIIFEGSGTPAAYVAYGDEDGTLRLSFYDTSFTLAEGFTSQFVSGATVQQEGAATVLTLQTNGIWGYSLEYADGTTHLHLKAPPRQSGDAVHPLAGVRIMLDPGHGSDADIGSPGVLWGTGPHEKDLNLALAQAIAYRLRQLGAEVLMTREDDSFPTLQERLEAQTIYKPDLFLSVHHNALEPDRDINSVSGVEAYYFHPYNTPASQNFAETLMEHISAGTGRTNRKVGWYAFYVTRTTVCPSVLFEYGFAMNPAEFADTASLDGIWNAAFATAEAMVQMIPK